MSSSELAALREAEAEMERKLLELRNQRAVIERIEREKELEAQKLAELSKPIELRVSFVSAHSIAFTGDYRWDVVEVFRSIPGRTYRGSQENSIPIKEFSEARKKLEALPFVTLIIKPEQAEFIEWATEAPAVLVDYSVEDQMIYVEPGPTTNLYLNRYTIPGVEERAENFSRRKYFIPLAESWRLPETLARYTPTYSNRALMIVEEQTLSRQRLDKIALKMTKDYPPLQKLTRPIYNRRTGRTESFYDALTGFQGAMIEFMCECDGGMINADDTGLGKTWTSIGRSELLHMEIRESDKNPQTLVVAKAANLTNWYREIENLTGAPPFVCVSGRPSIIDTSEILVKRAPYVLISMDTLSAILHQAEDGKILSRAEAKAKANSENLGVNFPWVTLFNLAAPDMLIVDEAHNLRNTTTRRWQAIRELNLPPNRIALTASPTVNSAMDLYPLIHITKPGLFDQANDFKEQYTSSGGRQPRNAEDLHRMMRTFFLRRTKKEVMKDLPDVTRIPYFHDLTPGAKEAYKEVLSGIYTKLEAFSPGSAGEQQEIFSILAQLTRLAQICAADKAQHFTPQLLKELAEENPSSKFLVFTHWLGTAHTIASLLGDAAACTVTRTGDEFYSMNAHERDQVFEAARTNPAIRFIVTTEAATEGSNIEYCDTVVFNDPFWTAKAHYQGEGRSHGRLSNPTPINALYIRAQTDIEDFRFATIERKMALAEGITNGIEQARTLAENNANEIIDHLRNNLWKMD
jgi:superfamily II DNA or RNA helicase